MLGKVNKNTEHKAFHRAVFDIDKIIKWCNTIKLSKEPNVRRDAYGKEQPKEEGESPTASGHITHH